MSDESHYKNNPLHGLGLKDLLTELVSYYGFDILYAYLHINCFNKNPSIDSSVKFLKKTDWAREKLEAFYMYTYKSFPKASDEQFQLPPRDRIVPEGQTAGEPAELSLEDAERLREKRAKKAAEYDSRSNRNYRPKRNHSYTSSHSGSKSSDPWAKWKDKP